jgi:hypothetical protein
LVCTKQKVHLVVLLVCIVQKGIHIKMLLLVLVASLVNIKQRITWSLLAVSIGKLAEKGKKLSLLLLLGIVNATVAQLESTKTKTALSKPCASFVKREHRFFQQLKHVKAVIQENINQKMQHLAYHVPVGQLVVPANTDLHRLPRSIVTATIATLENISRRLPFQALIVASVLLVLLLIPHQRFVKNALQIRTKRKTQRNQFPVHHGQLVPQVRTQQLHHQLPTIALVQIVRREHFKMMEVTQARPAAFVRRDMRFQQRQRLVLHVREKPTKRKMLLQQ